MFNILYYIYVCLISYTVHIEEGNGNPLQYSCLGNPTDREAWRARIYGITKSRT